MILQQVKHALAFDKWWPSGAAQARLADGGSLSERLCEGALVRFSSAATADLAGKVFKVTARRRYHFAAGGFDTFDLLREPENIPLSLIVTGEDTAQPYLAISRRISQGDLKKLLPAEDLEKLNESTGLKTLFLREQAAGWRGWVVMKYQRRMDGIRGTVNSGRVTRAFSYTLYVNETDDHAIEIERYPEGVVECTATLYRPVSDIAEVVQPRKPATPAVILPSPETVAPVLPEAKQPSVLPSLKNRESAKVMPIAKDTVIKRVEPEPSMAAKPATEKPKPAAVMAETLQLACEPVVAATLLEEAILGDMRISDVLRKILGLPVNATETVAFTLPLSGADYQRLAAHYDLAADAKDAIRKRVIEDINGFAGKAKRVTKNAS